MERKIYELGRRFIDAANEHADKIPAGGVEEDVSGDNEKLGFIAQNHYYIIFRVYICLFFMPQTMDLATFLQDSHTMY